MAKKIRKEESKEEKLKKGEVVEEEEVDFDEGESAEPVKESITDESGVVDENKVIQTIILGSDWQEVLTTLVAEEGMDPLSVDLIKLADAFRSYLEHLKQFDFRIPARFILVAAILLRMKAELLLDEEEEKIIRTTQSQPLDIENIPTLLPPITRKPTRKVTLNELVSALNKAFQFQERKEDKKIRMRRAIERLIEPEDDVEVRIKEIYEEIVSKKSMTFSQLVPAWKKLEIVKTFLPLLHLATRDMITCEQEEMFKEIFIRIKLPEEKHEQGVVQ
ncbi:MAG: segregation and condensation protein A [archaeon GW2011_AR5]|nr:MAG: segregation and condensation protein A [archaeon GW2011_AR5]